MSTTETKVRYTATPWTVEPWTYENGKRTVLTIISPGSKDAIAQLCNLWRPSEEPEATDAEEQANADYIVRAVNSHADMLEALRFADLKIRQLSSPGDLSWNEQGMAKISVAIAKARGKE